MKKEWKEKWAKALRSGEYKQERGGLKCGDGFCCLGVLCDLWIKEHPEEGRWETDKDANFFSRFTYLDEEKIERRSTNSVPIFIVDKIDLTRSNALIGLNDIDKKSFQEIADWIEENL